MLPSSATSQSVASDSNSPAKQLSKEPSFATIAPPVAEKTANTQIFVHNKPTQTLVSVSDSLDATDLIHSSPVVATRVASATETVEMIDTEPRIFAEGVFVGEGKAKSGEKIFLRMEMVTNENRADWDKYCHSTAQLTKHDRSVLTAAMRTTEALSGEDGTIRYRNEQYEELADRLGQSKEEFNDFVNMLGKNGYAWLKENRPRIRGISNVHAGATHLNLNTDGDHYVVYASKTPDFRMPKADKPGASSEPMTYHEYTRLYSDLLICVGIHSVHKDYVEDDSVHSKGMFRNPTSCIEKTYKSIAMVLRGFSGAVVKKYFPDKKTMDCQPLASMQYAISSSLQAQDYRVYGMSHEEALAIAKESIRDGDVGEMPWNSIKIGALDQFYRHHAKI